MTNEALNKKREKMVAKARQLDQDGDHISYQIDRLNALEQMSDESIRIYNVNARRGIEFKGDFVNGRPPHSPAYGVNDLPLYQKFAEAGDPLCAMIVEAVKGLREGSIECVLKGSTIMDRLINRSMTQSEYEGYLNGTIPITQFNPDERFPYDYLTQLRYGHGEGDTSRLREISKARAA